MTFAEWLQNQLESRDWEQAELVRRSNLDSGLVSRLLSGERKPSPEVCIALATALQLPREEIFRVRGWLEAAEPTDTPQPSFSPEAAEVAAAIDRLPSNLRRIALKVAKTTTEALRDEQGKEGGG